MANKTNPGPDWTAKDWAEMTDPENVNRDYTAQEIAYWFDRISGWIMAVIIFCAVVAVAACRD